jgi:outer membrane protein OmpA-like peptidoglycan-associated protein
LVEKRAEALRDLLIEAGLPQEKVLVSDEESTGLSGKQDLLLEIVSQGLLVPNPLPEELKGVHRIFFNFASPIFQGNGQEREFLRQAAEFLINNPSKKIYLTGFTDDTAARENNLKLGQKRANKVKDLLTDLGVPEGQIVASSKGEDEPIGNNNTESGRMQNRRVELLIND